MKKRRCAALLLAALMLLNLVACAGKGAGSEEPTVGETQNRIPTKKPIEEDKTDYGTLVTLPFSGLEETDSTLFDVTEGDGGLTVTAYRGTGAKVRIPEQIGGKPVVGIGDGVFRERSELTVLWIPDTVAFFGEEILVGCSALYALRTPLPQEEGKQYLGYLYGAETYEKNNMQDLRTLDFLIIGGEDTSLPAYSLYDCNDLVAVILPECVKTLESYSLYRCESLKYINAEGLSVLEPFAMAYCAAISSLSLGADLTEIGLGALESCDSLQSLTLPFVGGGNTESDYLGYVFGAKERRFSKGFYPSNLQNITLLSGCTALGNYAFYECESLCTVSLPEGLSSVGLRAFSGCIRLETISLPSTVRSVGENAFASCLSMKEATLGDSLQMLGVGAFFDCISLETAVLPNSLTLLPTSCFEGCETLQKVSMTGVESVGKNAFYGCFSLQGGSFSSDLQIADGNDPLKALLKS